MHLPFSYEFIVIIESALNGERIHKYIHITGIAMGVGKALVHCLKND